MSLWLSPVLAIALLASSEPQAVRLQLEPGLRCELGGTIGRALTEQQVQVASAADASGWVVSMQREGEAVLLRLTNPEGVVRGARRLKPTDADCPALPRTVALLVKSWLQMRLSAAVADPPAELSAPATVARPSA
ncbi:MAG: hypothetical protein H6Q89_3812, partial [Myxococcaceae bacterium]|nr:hypothetical protein [Myxococcaceae bacterium]